MESFRCTEENNYIPIIYVKEGFHSEIENFVKILIVKTVDIDTFKVKLRLYLPVGISKLIFRRN